MTTKPPILHEIFIWFWLCLAGYWLLYLVLSPVINWAGHGLIDLFSNKY